MSEGSWILETSQCTCTGEYDTRLSAVEQMIAVHGTPMTEDGLVPVRWMVQHHGIPFMLAFMHQAGATGPQAIATLRACGVDDFEIEHAGLEIEQW